MAMDLRDETPECSKEPEFGALENVWGEKIYRNICNRCPVLAVCQNYAILNEEYGFWGALSEKERKKARKDLRGDQILEAKKRNLLLPHSPLLARARAEEENQKRLLRRKPKDPLDLVLSDLRSFGFDV